MSSELVLAHFTHGQPCHYCCANYNAIDLKALLTTDICDDDATGIFVRIINDAVGDHLDDTHCYTGFVVKDCHFVWKDNKRGRNLLQMGTATLLAQMAFARARGWVDDLHIKYELEE
ncbi:hypothetical protein F4679DRAFT_589185 [Xylaria curta]|nr:hypothetical protein F4679DRAFT_589185 [Xylaria curta]